MYLATDRYDDAIVFYEQMLKTNPKDTKAMGSIASMYFKKGDFDKGMEWQKKVAEAGGRQARLLHHDRRPGLGPLLPLPGPRPGDRDRTSWTKG